MTLSETLSHEVERVTEVRCFYRDTVALIPNMNVRPAIALMDAAIWAAHAAAGSGDAERIREAIGELEAFDFAHWQQGRAPEELNA
jgi:hypothetical protein